MLKIPSRPALLVVCAIALQMGISIAYSLTRHYTFKTSAYDIGDFEQALYNFIHHGRLLVTLAPPHVLQPWLAVHFSPILYAVAPLYMLFPDTKTLLILHSALIPLAAWPLYLALREILKSAMPAALLAIVYLINPFVWNAAIWDFHEIAFAPLFFACGFLAVVKRNRAGLVFSCIMLMMVKEHYGLAVFGFALLWYAQTRELRTALLLGLGGLLLMALVVGFIMPLLNPHGAHLMMQTVSDVKLNRYQWLSHPFSADILWQDFLVNQAVYVVVLLVPLLLLPLHAGMWLLPGIADAAANVLSLNPIMRTPYAYHNAALIVVLIVAFGITLAKRNTIQQRKTLTLVIIGQAVLVIAFSVVPWLSPRNPWEFGAVQLGYTTEDQEAVNEINGIVRRSGILVQNNVGGHFATQLNVFQFPDAGLCEHYIILRPQSPFSEHFGLLDLPYSVSRETFELAVTDARTHGYTAIYDQHGWQVLARVNH